jgi:NADH-quinone oxidoreductase subunit E
MKANTEITGTHDGLKGGIDAKAVIRILERHEGRRGGLIAILEAIQTRYGYLPEQALRILSDRTGRSLVDIYGVATFYRSFSLQPRGAHLIAVCLGTACHVRGAQRIVEAFQRELGIDVGETTPDGAFTLETVNCLGACALGPVVVVDGVYFSNVAMSDVTGILERARDKEPRIDQPEPLALAK